MRKILWMLGFASLIFSSVSYAETEQVENSDADELYMGSEVKPLEKELSEAERKQQNNEDFDTDVEGEKQPEISCGDEKLLRQVENFIYQKINAKETSSVATKRARLLLVRNMNAFTEISEQDISTDRNFNTSATLAYLKINQKRQIYKICRSLNNKSDKFGSIDIVLYPFAQYYKVVVTNLIPSAEKMDEGTFIYNW